MERICIEDLKGAKHRSFYCNCVVVLYISGTSNGYINIIHDLKKKKTQKPHTCVVERKRPSQQRSL